MAKKKSVKGMTQDQVNSQEMVLPAVEPAAKPSRKKKPAILGGQREGQFVATEAFSQLGDVKSSSATTTPNTPRAGNRKHIMTIYDDTEEAS